MGNSISCVSISLLNMTLSALFWVGISSLHCWLSWVGPFIFFLPFDLCHVIMTSDPMDPKAAKLWSHVADVFKSCPSAVTLIPDPLYHPWTLHPFVSCQWYGIHHGPPSTWALPIDFNSLSGKLAERLPSSTLELACPSGKFFTLDEKFTSLAFDWVISRVFKFSSFIHIPRTMLLVPSEPLSLFVVPLVLVNSSHQWPVIKWLSSMFDLNTSIHMLEFVLWSGRVGTQDPGFILRKSRLQGDVIWSYQYTRLSQMDDYDHTMSCCMWSFSLLDGCDHTLVSIWSSLFDGCAHALGPFILSLFRWLHPYHDSCIIC